MRTAKKQEIQQKVQSLLNSQNVVEPPIDVEAIAASLGIAVRKNPTDDDISGFLFKQPGGQSIIGVNALHHPNRQRFTIAHEIGHYSLHDFHEVHVDKFVVRLRSGASSTGEDRDEVEANSFAAELLMPRHFIERDVVRFAKDLSDDKAIQQLAKRYAVSVQAMANRLTALGFISSSEFGV